MRPPDVPPPRAGTAPRRRRFAGVPVLSVVSPVYGEGKGVGRFVAAVREVLEPLRLPYEIILVDDVSPDDSWHHMEREAKRCPAVRCLRLSRNFGKEAALAAGLEAARGQAVISLDSDLQHPPALIPEMVRLWRSGEADVVEAEKERRQEESAASRLLAGVFYRMFALISPFDLTNAGDFKLMDRRAVDAWKSLNERRLFFRGMSRWVGFRRRALPFTPLNREEGAGKWSFPAKLVLAVDSLSAYSAKPLSIISVLGVLFALLAVAVGGEALWMKLHGKAMTGFTTVILLILLTGAAIQASVCLLAVYVRQIFHEVKRRPRYLVSEVRQSPPAGRKGRPGVSRPPAPSLRVSRRRKPAPGA